MTSLGGSAELVLTADDQRLLTPVIVRHDYRHDVHLNGAPYRALWTRSGILGSTGAPQSWLFWPTTARPSAMLDTLGPGGSERRKTITGITRDSSGNALGGVTVMAFHTSDNRLDDTITSGPSGEFTCAVVDGDSYYILCYKPGAPDVYGTSINTVTPT